MRAPSIPPNAWFLALLLIPWALTAGCNSSSPPLECLNPQPHPPWCGDTSGSGDAGGGIGNVVPSAPDAEPTLGGGGGGSGGSSSGSSGGGTGIGSYDSGIGDAGRDVEGPLNDASAVDAPGNVDSPESDVRERDAQTALDAPGSDRSGETDAPNRGAEGGE